MNQSGTVFKIITNGTLASLYLFTGGNDGKWPLAGLVQGSDGNFYGTTTSGGTSQSGTVFKISPEGSFSSLCSFTGGNDGANPQACLVQGSDGNFYGTTQFGGTNQSGTVFKISPEGSFTSLYSFTGGNDGEYPYGGLVQGRDGNFYGTTLFGGVNGGHGTVFKISANGSFSSLYSFTGGNDGANPQAGLVEGRDSNFYGTTVNGGVGGVGTVFQLTIVPAPVFQTIELAQGTLNLTWSTVVGASYQLQYNSGLNSANWTGMGSPLTATGLTLNSTTYVTNSSPGFYRAVRLVVNH
jgi:uncharacterized repeat protein (TIGR03803 family)